MAKPNAAFAALADPTRRAILETLRGGGQSAGGIAGQLDVSWPAISRHLRILKAAGLVGETREGRSRYYEVNQAALSPVVVWLAQFKPEPPALPAHPPSGLGSVGREYIS